MVHGVRPIYLDAQGREQLGGLHGKDSGRPPVRVKAKKGYAVGAISAKTGVGIDGLSVTFMKLDKGRLDPDQSYESDWLGGQGGGGADATGRIGRAGCRLVRLAKQQLGTQRLGVWFYPINRSLPPRRRNRRCRTKPPRPRPSNWPKRSTAKTWAAAKIPSQKRDLAQKLLHGADESENDPAGRYILLKLARDAATQAIDGLLAFEAIDKMAEQFQVDDVEMKTERVDRLQQAGQIAGRSQGDRRAGRRADRRRDCP